MKKEWLLLSSILSIFLISLSLVSAGIYFSAQPAKVYNVGESVEIGINVDPVSEEYLLSVNLICSGNSVLQFNLMPGSEGNSKLKLPLNYFTIPSLNEGNCYFFAKYGGNERESTSFAVSKKLDLSLDLSSIFVKPGEEITISGTATRLSGLAANGEAEISIPLLNLIKTEEITDIQNEAIESEINETSGENEESETNETSEDNKENIKIDNGQYYTKVVDGKFSLSLNLSENTPGGDYRIDVLVYEKDSVGRVISEGSAISNLKISQVLTSADVALDSQNLNPGDTLNLRPMLLDQAGFNIDDDLSVIIRDKDSNRIFEKLVSSEEPVKYDLPTNLTAGYYTIEASKGELNSTKKFYVNEKAIADLTLENETLTVTNIGNIPYDKEIQIELNGKPFIRKVNLGLGESQKFKLTGDGDTNIKVSDGDKEIAGTAKLTGYAVDIKSVEEGGSVTLNTPIVWIILIVFLLGGLLFLFRGIFKKKSFAYQTHDRRTTRNTTKTVSLRAPNPEREHSVMMPNESHSEKKEYPGHAPYSAHRDVEKKTEFTKPVEKIPMNVFLAAPNHAEQVSVLKGQKDKVAVVALKIKNRINKSAKEYLEKLIEPVYSKRGAIFEQGDYILVIFSPLMTHSIKNEIEAVKFAEKIKLMLSEYNKKFKDRIEFGIGINYGDMINKIEDGKLKYTALGNTIISAKKLSELSHEQVFLTRDAYEKGIAEIKAEKKEIHGLVFYEVKRVVNHEKNEKFIEGFLKRMNKDTNRH